MTWSEEQVFGTLTEAGSDQFAHELGRRLEVSKVSRMGCWVAAGSALKRPWGAAVGEQGKSNRLWPGSI